MLLLLSLLTTKQAELRPKKESTALPASMTNRLCAMDNFGCITFRCPMPSHLDKGKKRWGVELNNNKEREIERERSMEKRTYKLRRGGTRMSLSRNWRGQKRKGQRRKRKCLLRYEWSGYNMNQKYHSVNIIQQVLLPALFYWRSMRNLKYIGIGLLEDAQYDIIIILLWSKL